jgi:hypothetical protein
METNHRLRLRRRDVLNTFGLGAGTLFLPSLLGDRRAHAAGPPKRLIIFYTDHGPQYEAWMMRRPGLPDKDKDWEFPLDGDVSTWTPMLQLLYPHRKDLLILDGLAQTSANADKYTNTHNMGMAHILSNAKMRHPGGPLTDGGVGGPSVDQLIAEHVAVPGRTKYLFFSPGVGTWAPVGDLAGNQMRVGERSPKAAFDRLFPGGKAMAADPAAEAALAAERQQNVSVLDFVKSRYDQVLPRLGVEDRQKLLQHQSLIADLAKELSTRGSITCAAPEAAPGPSGNSVADCEAFFRVATAALACDLTRVVTIHHDQLAPAAFGAPAMSASDVHNRVAHNARPENADTWKLWINYYKTHATQFAKLLTMLKSVPEGNGTLLDNTAVVWTSQLAGGTHNLKQIWMTIAGSCGGAFRTGRYVKYAETEANPRMRNTFPDGKNAGVVPGEPLGPAHSKLLVSLMQAFGMQTSSIGMTSAPAMTPSGEMVTVDMTGPLRNLR